MTALTYADSGVSLYNQNKVNQEIKDILTQKGFNTAGMFGGALKLDISALQKNPFLNVYGTSLSQKGNLEQIAESMTSGLIKNSLGIPLGVLDYVATPNMDDGNVARVVKGVANASLDQKILLFGGESAEMPDTYVEGGMDAFIHALFLNSSGGVNLLELVKHMAHPYLVASTDGTGTKTKIVRNPLDIISHGFNDIGAQGAKPVGFALYIAGNVPLEELNDIDKKATEIAKQLGIHKFQSIIEQKDTYQKGEVDIAGTVVGVVDENKLIKGENITESDVIIGIQSNGIMTNGYSLARKAMELIHGKDGYLNEEKRTELGNVSIREALSAPHVPYTDILFGYNNALGVLEKFDVKATAHITGGGIRDNIVRMIPDDKEIHITELNKLGLPKIFQYFRNQMGPEHEVEMFKAYNMGVGFTLVVPAQEQIKICQYINHHFANRFPGMSRKAEPIGSIRNRKEQVQIQYNWNRALN